MHFTRSIIVIALLTFPLLSSEISITGIVTDKEGKIIENALIRFEKAGYVTVSNKSGGFVLSEASPIQKKVPQIRINQQVTFRNGIIHFSVKGSEAVSFCAYTLQGRMCERTLVSNLSKGSYQAPIAGLLASETGAGAYVVTIAIGAKQFSTKVMHTATAHMPFAISRESESPTSLLLARKLGAVDTVTIAKMGYTAKSIPVESYQANIGTVVLEPSAQLSSSASIASAEDSLVKLFVERVQSIEDLEGPDELKTIDFISIRNGFEAILEKDSLRVKSNIGFMLSAIASLNVNSEIWKIADSLDKYFDDLDLQTEPVVAGSAEEPGLMKTALQKGGVLAMGKVMASKTVDIVAGPVQKPSFPKFLTMNYLQTVIEQHLLPVIDNVQKAAVRVEGLADGTMTVSVEDETFDIDKGEVYLFDSYISLLRANLYLMCAYDFDLLTAADKADYSWIDSLVRLDTSPSRIYSLKGDTLYEISTQAGEAASIISMTRTLKYNFENRPSFLTLRKPYHDIAFNCLKSVPYKIKAGLAAIKAETDDQENDLLKISMINDANGDMLDMSQELRDEGMTQAFCDNFSSIDKLMDFITTILSGPYTFDQTFDGKRVALTVDLSAMYKNPVQDLKTLLPSFGWTSDASWARADEYRYGDEGYFQQLIYNKEGGAVDTSYAVTVYKWDNDNEEVGVTFAPSIIDSVTELGYGRRYYLNVPVNYQVTIDSSYYFDALRLKDAEGNLMSEDKIEELIDNKTFFPYFKDYTFNGMFPGMTRDKWLDLIWSE